MSGPLSGRGYAPPYDQPRQPILPAIIVAAQPAIVVVATHFFSPVGRLDKASEGLLFLTNDTKWAERLMNPASGVEKTYHVKIDIVADKRFVSALAEPVVDDGERLSAASVRLLRTSGRSSWIEIVLTEGRNRQVRRMVAARGANVLRLVRVGIGGVLLGDLGKGQTRPLDPAQLARLSYGRRIG